MRFARVVSTKTGSQRRGCVTPSRNRLSECARILQATAMTAICLFVAKIVLQPVAMADGAQGARGSVYHAGDRYFMRRLAGQMTASPICMLFGGGKA